MTKKIAILGGGISGLSCAHFLKKAHQSSGVEIHVFEAGKRVGGWCQTRKWSEICSDPELDPKLSLELGPRTFRSNCPEVRNTLKLIKDVGLSEKLVVHDKQQMGIQCIHHNGQTIPMSPFSPAFLSRFFISSFAFMHIDFVLAFLGKLGSQDSKPDVTVAEYFRPRMLPVLGGNFLLDGFFGGMMHGIYAGSVEELSLQKVLPKIYASRMAGKGSVVTGAFANLSKKEPGSATSAGTEEESWMRKFSEAPCLSLEDGMQSLPLALAKSLTSYGEGETRIHCGQGISSMTTTTLHNEIHLDINNGSDSFVADKVISTIPVHKLAQTISSSSESSLQRKLARMQYNSLAVVNLLYKFDDPLVKDAIPIKGFGVLASQSSPFSRLYAPLLGIINNVRLGREGAKFASFNVMLGGHYWTAPGEGSFARLTPEQYELQAKRAALFGSFGADSSGLYGGGEFESVEELKKRISSSKAIQEIHTSIHNDHHTMAIQDGELESLEKQDILVHHAMAYLQRVLCIPVQYLRAFHVSLLPHAIPQYTPGHDDLWSSIDKDIRNYYPNEMLDLSLGNYRSSNGIGINHCVNASIRYANEAYDKLALNSGEEKARNGA